MTTFDIRLFGAIEIRRDGVLLTGFRSQKALVLLAYLICENRPITRDYLAGLAWPEMEQSQALGLLRRSLHDLNSQLPGCLEIDRRTVGFSPIAPTTVDIHTLANLIALHACDQDIATGAAMAALYHAPFLQGIYVDAAPELENWLLREQERWQQAVTRVLQWLIQHYTNEAAYALALRYVQQLLTLEPWREEAQRQAMLLLARTGQVSAALTQYKRCRQILQAELTVEPAPETERLYAQLKGIGHLPLSPLPASTTPIIGRTEELADLLRLLANPSSRLVTLIGPGGIGKTRLALEVARTVVSEQQRIFLHGVRVVALAGTDTAAQFVSALAQALAFTVQPQSPPEDQLCHYLRDKELLLLLDNFEQLIDAASVAFVTKLLQLAPAVKLLITSRVRLNLQGEQLYWMQGLHFPPAQVNHEMLELTELGQYSGLQLFIETAQRVQPTYSPSPKDLLAVVEICQLVQGMPLAIELAAAWICVLSPAKIVTEMQHTFDFLTSELHDLPLRQRSMRAVFDTSWRLLTPTEQAVFQQLSVFRGGFAREAAQAVAGATLPLLAQLQQHSFIQYQPSRERYAIHELLRQYGAEQLAQNADRLAHAHVQYGLFFCRLLTQLDAELKTSQQESALHTAEIENENLHAAWLWAVRYQLLDRADAAMDGLLRFDEWRGRYAEGASICELALTHLTTDLPGARQLQAKLLTWQGIFARYQGEPERADQLFHASLDLLNGLQLTGHDVRAAQAFLKLRMGKVAERMDRLKAVDYFEQSLTLCQRLNDDWGSAHALEALGFMALEGERYADATACYKESLRLFQTLGDVRSSLGALNQLAVSLTYEDKATEAFMCVDEAERIAAQIAEPALIAYTLARKSVVTCYFGKLEEVYPYLRRSLTIYEELGDRHTLPNAHLLLAEILLHLGRIGESQIHLQKALALVQSSGDSFYLGWARLMMGMASIFTREYGQAETQLYQSIELFLQSGQNRKLSECWSMLAVVAVGTNDPLRASHCLRNALGLSKDTRNLTSVHFALEVTTFYLCHQDALIEATELHALVNPYNVLKNSRWVDVVIRQPLRLATATLSPAVIASAQDRGRTFDLWSTAMSRLAQFASQSA